MDEKTRWIKNLFTRQHFALPLLNAAMFSWMMATLTLITIHFPNEMTPFVRWLLTGALFAVSFWLYIHWDEAEDEIEEVVDDMDD